MKTPTSMPRPALLLPLCLGLLACGPRIYFSDDEGGPRPGGSTFDHPDELSLPYAQGTRVNIAIRGIEDIGAWQVRSDAPAVFSVDRVSLRDRRLIAECTAAGEGEAGIRLLDDKGAEQRSARVRVRAPDRARLFAHGPLRIAGRQESSFPGTEVLDARILAGGKGAFAVAYYRGGERLYGRGVFQSEAPAGVKVEPATTAGFGVNEWIFLTPQAGGPYTLRLRHKAAQILDMPVIAVPEADLAAFTLVEEQSDQAAARKAGDEIWVLAEARDRAGRQVHGLYATWKLDGAAQVGRDNNVMKTQGDLYRYEYAPTQAPRQLQASAGRLQAAFQVQAAKGYVEDTTYLGCSVAGPGRRAGGSGAVLLVSALVAFALLVRRRRRAALCGLLALSGCDGSVAPGGGCRAHKDCLSGYYCAGPNDRNACGIPPREQCADDAGCVGQRCHAISDPCSPDGVGSECRGPCTAASCGPGFRCNAKEACEPVPCDEGFTCPSHQRCDPAVARAAGPVHGRTSGCVDIPCAADAACPTGKVCVNARCQDGAGSCKQDIPVP
jgi:hypothetical protein